MHRERITVRAPQWPIRCSFFEDEDECPEPGAFKIYFDTMVSEDVPARYPRGSERPGRRLTSTGCVRHVEEFLGIDLLGVVPGARPTAVAAMGVASVLAGLEAVAVAVGSTRADVMSE